MSLPILQPLSITATMVVAQWLPPSPRNRKGVCSNPDFRARLGKIKCVK